MVSLGILFILRHSWSQKELDIIRLYVILIRHNCTIIFQYIFINNL